MRKSIEIDKNKNIKRQASLRIMKSLCTRKKVLKHNMCPGILDTLDAVSQFLHELLFHDDGGEDTVQRNVPIMKSSCSSRIWNQEVDISVWYAHVCLCKCNPYSLVFFSSPTSHVFHDASHFPFSIFTPIKCEFLVWICFSFRSGPHILHTRTLSFL